MNAAEEREAAKAKYGAMFDGSGVETAIAIMSMMEQGWNPYAGTTQWKDWWVKVNGSVVDTL